MHMIEFSSKAPNFILKMDQIAHISWHLIDPHFDWFSWAKPASFYFSSSNFTVQDHIRSTAGDA